MFFELVVRRRHCCSWGDTSRDVFPSDDVDRKCRSNERDDIRCTFHRLYDHSSNNSTQIWSIHRHDHSTDLRLRWTIINYPVSIQEQCGIEGRWLACRSGGVGSNTRNAIFTQQIRSDICNRAKCDFFQRFSSLPAVVNSASYFPDEANDSVAASGSFAVVTQLSRKKALVQVVAFRSAI